MLLGMRRGEGLVCRCVTNDIETLITALYVKIDDELGGPRWLGRPPVLTDSELVCAAVALAALRAQAPVWPVPVPAAAVRVQQAAAGGARAGQAGHPDARPVD